MEFLPEEVKESTKLIHFTIFKPKTKEELKKAVNLWCDNKDEASNKYGDISNWDVSLIRDMSYLFYKKYNFNDNLSNWDVSSVYSMVCMLIELPHLINLLIRGICHQYIVWNVCLIKLPHLINLLICGMCHQ